MASNLPQERERSGKNPVGQLLLKGRHQAGQVVIEIADDGRGLDREQIVEKAMQQGLISIGEGLSDNEAFNLIFQPGFTTAAAGHQRFRPRGRAWTWCAAISKS